MKLKTIFTIPARRNRPFFTTSSKGLSLIEILVALFLMLLVVTAFFMGSDSFSPHRQLETALNDLERAMRFTADEATLRNRITRLTLDLETTPSALKVEYGPDQDFVLPKRLTELNGYTPVSLKEKEEENLRNKKLDQKFSPVEEFKGGDFSLPPKVNMVAVGSSLGDLFFTEGKASLYFYPSGEKDSAIIILATEEELATLSNEAFTMDFKRNIEPFVYETEEALWEKARELHKKWQKK